MGPTGVGKTDLSLQIAGSEFEVISFDSVQVYKYLDIGSSKPNPEQRQNVKHHLIDIVYPDYSFNAGDFCEYAEQAVDRIQGNGKIPLFVGGTGLYLDSFMNGMIRIPDIKPEIREELVQLEKEKGSGFLYNELSVVDRTYANKVHVNDKQRIMRGLEVFRGTGRPYSSYQASTSGRNTEETLYIGLYAEREILLQRINQRVDRMIDDGFIEEVNRLREMGYGPGLRSMSSIGYAEINLYLDNRLSKSDSIEKIKFETKRYSKKQMTWFKRNKSIKWFRYDEFDKIIKLVSEWDNRERYSI